MESYFGLEEEEDQNLAPEIDERSGAYAFGGGATPAVPQGGFSFGPT
jgi:hypothetical protein